MYVKWQNIQMEELFRESCWELPRRKMKMHHVAEDKWRDTIHRMCKGAYPNFAIWMPLRARVKNTSCALAPQQTLFGLSVTEAVLSAAQADTLHSLASGFAQSEPCERSSQCSVAGRHLHHIELRGRGRPPAGGQPPPLLQIYSHVYAHTHVYTM